MNFAVYKSSAGSGKTFTLVKEYLKLVLEDPRKFRTILAVTFTNKAANEMKSRILEYLKGLSDPESIKNDALFYLTDALCKESNIPIEVIPRKAKQVLSLILHHYADFAISTIDSFIHRIIRTFAYDLKIPMNFEVEIDTEESISRAVDMILNMAGRNKELTQILVGFIENKTENERSWHIENDLFDIAQNLLNEEAKTSIIKLKDISLNEFIRVGNEIRKSINKFENDVRSKAEETLQILDSAGIDENAFYFGSRGIAGYYKSLASGKFDKIKPNNNVLKTIEDNKWYSGKASNEDRCVIDAVSEAIRSNFNTLTEYIKEHHEKYILARLVRENLYPVALLNELVKILDQYKEDNNIVFISEFNEKITEVVMEQSAPFIYERIGEKYLHYFIDEFQDTSILQWRNMLPLIENALANLNLNLVVGDGKQAIYRWRNGEVEQFARLPEVYKNDGNPHLVEREKALKRNYKLRPLNSNYRSKAELVDFNNRFFSYVAGFLPEEYQSIYSGLEQNFNPDNNGGQIQIEFIRKDDNLTSEELFLNAILSKVRDLTEKGFLYSDIAILCRSNKNACAISSFLLENNIDVVSSESLLLQNSPEVNFLLAHLRYISDPGQMINCAEIVNYLIASGQINLKLDDSLNELWEKTSTVRTERGFKTVYINLYACLGNNGFIFRENIKHLSLYDLIEELIRIFQLNIKPDPYIQYFLDAVLEFSKNNSANIIEFLDWWEKKKHKLSIIIPEGINAVKIMTIHKAKGLEFPVVIYPFANERHKLTKDPLWIDLDGIFGLPVSLVPAKKQLQETRFADSYNEEENKSLLDLLNLLYVVFTRASERLYIMSLLPPKKSSTISVPSLLKLFLQSTGDWDESKSVFPFGSETKKAMIRDFINEPPYTLDTFISKSWNERIRIRSYAMESWDIDCPERNLYWGNLVHYVLSEIVSADDLNTVLDNMVIQGIISPEEHSELHIILTDLIADPRLSPFFEKGLVIRNESEIIASDGKIYRPDRVILKPEKTIIIDYKTGKPEKKHELQISQYRKLLAEMGYTNIISYLIYLENEIIVKEV